jgi:CelD/BcsL family acetyltransferase involved in cellulose biosynthesis
MYELALAGNARGTVSRAAAERISSHPFSCDVMVGADAYHSLAAEWRQLAALQQGVIPFQMPGFLSVWAQHFTDGRSTPVTVILRDRGRAILLWPLLVERRALVTIASGAGSPIGQYDEILLDPDYDAAVALAAALDALKAKLRPDLIFLENVRADGALRRALGNREPHAAIEAAPFADLSRGVPALMKTLKPRVTRQQRKRVRRFAEEGNVGFEVARDGAEAETWLKEAVALKREWLRSTGRVSRAFLKRETADCLDDLADALTSTSASVQMVVSRLTLDGKTAAIEMGFRHDKSYHLYLGAFVPKFAKLGPGNVLTEKVLEWCAANGIERYDMMAPRSRNKSEWQSGETRRAC